MSKILDILNHGFKHNKKPVDPIQEELAKTFFSSTTSKVPYRHKMAKTPWIIAGLACIIALFIFIFNSKIDIQVRIMGEVPSLSQSGPESDSVVPSGKGFFLIKNGKPNAYLIRETVFSGDAAKYSRESEDMLVLTSLNEAGWANFSIELKMPVNMANFDISYIAKGQSGDEHLLVVLVDKDNRVYRMARDLSSGLTNEWENHTVNLSPVGNSVDLTRIRTIKFEFGTLTARNCSMATIFLKDAGIVAKTRGAKWL